MAKCTVSITGLPALIAELRLEMAKSLRRIAKRQPADVAAILREIAAAYEAGQSNG